jgi:hypothetical protein
MYLDLRTDNSIQFLHTLQAEAKTARARGDVEDADAIEKSILEYAHKLMLDILQDKDKEDRLAIFQTIAVSAAQEGPHQEFNQLLFKYLEENLDLDANS